MTLLPDCHEQVEVAGVLGMAWEIEGSNTANWRSVMELCSSIGTATLALRLINVGHCGGWFCAMVAFIALCTDVMHRERSISGNDCVGGSRDR